MRVGFIVYFFLATFASASLAENKTIKVPDWYTTAATGFRVGESQVEGYVDFLIPFWQQGKQQLFFNPRFVLADEGNNQFNLGLGYRRLLNEHNGVFGANLYYDSRESNLGNRYSQIGFGLEWLGSIFDARVNTYAALDDTNLANSFNVSETETTQQVALRNEVFTSSSATGLSAPVASGNGISQTVRTDISTRVDTTKTTTTRTVQTDRLFEQFEGTMDGWDAEIGVKLPLKKGPEVRLFGGYYFYKNPFEGGENVEGFKSRIDIRSGQYLSFDVEWFEDSFDPSESGGDFFVGARLEIPLTGKDSLRKVFSNLFTSPEKSLRNRWRRDLVRRDVRIHTRISKPAENVPERVQVISSREDVEKSSTISRNSAVTDIELGTNFYFVDVDNGGVENGTIELPYRTVAAAVAAAPTNATVFICEHGGGVCDLGGGGGTYDETTGITLKSGQTITSTAQGIPTGTGTGSFTTQNRPNITNSAQTFNTGVINTAAGGNTINRLTIDARNLSTRHGVRNNSNTGEVVVKDSQITVSGVNSNVIANVQTQGKVTVSNNTLISNAQNGDGVENNMTQGAVIVSNNTFTGTAQNSRGVYSVDTTGDITINNNTLNTTGNAAESVQNTRVQGLVTIEDNQLSTTGTGSIAVLNADSSANFVLKNNTINTADGDGISNLRISGTSSISDNTINTNGRARQGVINNANTGSTSVTSNTITTVGDVSQGVQNFRTTGSVNVSDNQIITSGDRSNGVDNNQTTGTVVVSNNTINTSNAVSRGIFNNRTTAAVTVSNNDVTTTGSNSDGIRNADNTADVEVANNTIKTTDGDGVSNLRTVNLSVTNNTIDTNGNNREGIQNNQTIVGGSTQVSDNKVTTSGDGAEGIVNLRTAGSVTLNKNEITTSGSNAEAIEINRTTGAINVTNNQLATTGAGAEGILSFDATSGDALIDNNQVTTSGSSADGIEVARNAGKYTVSNNTVNTTGSNAVGVILSLGSGDIDVLNNTVTAGDAEGIRNSQTSGTVLISNNQVSSNGTNREGIDNNQTTGVVTVEKNTVTTNGSGSHAVRNNRNVNTVNIDENTLNTNHAAANSVRNNSGGGGAVNITNNTNCVITGGTHVVGTTLVTQSGNTNNTQAACP